ncbi:WD40 repeat-like protein [Rhizopogon vinicolor AM-OR11-026]|uniref:WD40 repeat-like protein n=1 Tax=Rhizopogon vinicolor AM-OR11-026 TaxID=1314800 RepID=A0A1B7MW51_9AGAM|nr:WD40 repeat-like protein [Rhizopogon vinicolor AM-OR11-026]
MFSGSSIMSSGSSIMSSGSSIMSSESSIMSFESSIMSTLDGDSVLRQPRLAPKHEFKDHYAPIWSFVFLHDNVHIVSSSQDGTMCKWDCDTGLVVGKPWGSGGERIYALALSPDGKTISCGRGNGRVEMWNTDGEMSEGIWTGHSSSVRAFSWSPSGDHITSVSYDGTILIPNAGNGEVEYEVGPIETQQGKVYSLAYSHSGDRIASGGSEKTICIWNSNTGELLVGPIEDLGESVESIVWSLDDSKLYSTSDKFARVFDSTSGTELHCLKHDDFLFSIALSPKHNVLACAGMNGTVQLWDTESHKPLGQPFPRQDCKHLRCVSFSPDGQYLAYSGHDNKITLWMVKDIAPELPSLTPSCVEVDTADPFARTESDEITEKGLGNVYDDFFRSFEPSRPSRRPHPFSAWRSWNFLIPSRHAQPADQSIPLQPYHDIKRSFFARHTGPQPVTVFAGRPRKLYWMAPRPVVPEDQSAGEEDGNTNVQTGQPPSSIVTPTSAAQADSPHMPRHPQIQPATQPVEEEYDYGCWGNFWYIVCCMSRRPRDISGVQAAAS